MSDELKCRYCDADLIHNYMCFLIRHPYNGCAFSGQESKSHWGKDTLSKFGTNDFLPDSYIKSGSAQPAKGEGEK